MNERPATVPEGTVGEGDGPSGVSAEWEGHRSPNQRAWERFKRNRPALVSAWFLAVAVGILVISPVLRLEPLRRLVPEALTHSPLQLSDEQFRPPSAAHWFGTDVHGRDLLSRVLFGARISLMIGLLGAGVSLVIGGVWGAVAGYLGGRVDSLMMRFVDILYSLPSIVFVIVLITTLEQFFQNWLIRVFSPDSASLARVIFLFMGLGAVSWLTMARIVRGQVLTLRTRNFIDAARVLGASHRRILFRHILPNVAGVMLVYLTLTVPGVILYESFLSYLGLGIQPPEASLGSLIAEGASQLNPIRIYWWMIVWPGVVLTTILLALNFLGDGLRDAFDPKSLS